MTKLHVEDGRSHKKQVAYKDKGSQRQHNPSTLDSVSSVVDLRRPSQATLSV